MFPCSADHEQDWQPYAVGLYSAISDDDTCIHIYSACTLNYRLLSGNLGVVAGTLRGFLFPVRYGSVGVQLTRLRALYQGTLTSECVFKILNALSYKLLVKYSNPREFFFLDVFKEVLSSELVGQKQKKTNDNQQKTRLEASKTPTVFTTASKFFHPKGHQPVSCIISMSYHFIYASSIQVHTSKSISTHIFR